MATATAVRERPILFSSEMIRAIRDGRKTQTRRVMKPQLSVFVHGKPHVYGRPCEDTKEVRCPYGDPGDRLWVKETHRFPVCFDDKSASEIAASALNANYRKPWAPTRYDADKAMRAGSLVADFGGGWGKTRVSIHMPRWASRILLEITGVRVERLQDISEDDKAAEGATPDMPFGSVWRRINTKPGIRWEDNPWVWVIAFRVLEGLGL